MEAVVGHLGQERAVEAVVAHLGQERAALAEAARLRLVLQVAQAKLRR